ncbi:MAG TPA: encapsulin-associated ferritin-like protein [Acidimicrobiia bacterium]|jgi:ferritin-like protein|nr:encapsulin-associated ferritin-like protein [Acidimicrobiia bacterium]
MAGSSATLHESPEVLGSEAIDRHRAIVSVMEELEAIDWYDQRAIATGDDELRAVLEHNRDDEKEHAAMALEWLRRHDAFLDGQLRKYLFIDGSIAALEDADDASDDDVESGSLGIGSLRAEVTS